MEHLDHRPDHFPDLVKQEALPLQVKPHELNSVLIRFISDCKGLSVHVHELISRHAHHVPRSLILMRFHILCEVMILLCSCET